MKASELRDLLETVAVLMENLKIIFPVELNKKTMAALEHINPQTIVGLSVLFDMDKDKLQASLQGASNTMKILDNLFTTGLSDSIAWFCRALMNRTLILKAIALIL